LVKIFERKTFSRLILIDYFELILIIDIMLMMGVC